MTVVRIDQVGLPSTGAVEEIVGGDLQLHVDPGLAAERRQELTPLATVVDGRDAEQAYHTVRPGSPAALASRRRRAAPGTGGYERCAKSSGAREDVAATPAATTSLGGRLRSRCRASHVVSPLGVASGHA